MRSIILLPILLAGMVLQTTVFGKFVMIAGKPDLLLLMLISWNLNKDDDGYFLWAIFAGALYAVYSSALPIMPFIAYLICTFAVRKIKSMTFDMPLLVTILSTLISSILFYGLFLSQIWVFSGFQTDISSMLWSITVPSIFLNLLLILPVNSIMKEFVKLADPNPENA